MSDRNKPVMSAGGMLVWAQGPALLLGYLIYLQAGKHGLAMLDFDAVRSGAHAVLNGRSPYPPPVRSALLPSHSLVYPPLVAYLFIPFALVPTAVAGAIYFVLSFASLVAVPRILGVRDLRCYAVLFLGYPALLSLGFGTLDPLLALALAVAWRHRDNVWIVAPMLAPAIVAKLFLWPLILWLVATRRWKTAMATAAASVVAFALPFAGFGWSTFRSYPHLLHVLDDVFGPESYSVQEALRVAGVRGAAVLVATLGVGALFAATVVGLGRAGRDRHAFTVALTAALALSPISWIHYFVLLLVPISVARPRLSPLWFLPIAYWPLGMGVPATDPVRLAVALPLVGLTVARCLVPRPAIDERDPEHSIVDRTPALATPSAWT